MCSGGTSAETYALRNVRRAKISNIKSRQQADVDSIDVAMGGSQSHRLSIKTGAKTLGSTKESQDLITLSTLFTGNKVIGSQETQRHRKKLTTKDMNRDAWESQQATQVVSPR